MNNPTPQDQAMQKINRALGLFLVCFSVIILVAVFFTETIRGKLTNCIAGLILAAIGLAMISRAKDKS